jgi:hypothetical protein
MTPNRSKEIGIVTDSTFDSPVIQIPLTRGHAAIVNTIDSDLSNFNWFTTSDSVLYAARFRYINPVKKQCLKMHRVIMERILDRALIEGEFVDHINHDGLDNRRCNLRLATQAENQRNRGKNSNNASGYKGVHWHKLTGKWQAQITVNRKRMQLGVYENIDDAARAYNEAALKFHLGFAVLNNIADSLDE